MEVRMNSCQNAKSKWNYDKQTKYVETEHAKVHHQIHFTTEIHNMRGFSMFVFLKCKNDYVALFSSIIFKSTKSMEKCRKNQSQLSTNEFRKYFSSSPKQSHLDTLFG